MKGLENMLKPILGLLEITVPETGAECKEAEFLENLIQDYIPEDLPKDLMRRFVVDFVNKNPEETKALLKELRDKIGVFLYGDKIID